MDKVYHEIRDPIHVFIRVDNQERRIVDSEPVQRLRHVHQLALSSLVYPGASHKRFEHSLGTMELASRVFDVLAANLDGEALEILSELRNPDVKSYWRRVLRMAALCHDIGHLPFSHAAEHELLPEGWDHERLTRALLESDVMAPVWKADRPPIEPEDVVRLAVGKKKAPDLKFTPVQEILSEIVVGDAFGVDRMDYLLRDSHHAGVAYGRFDHYRLVDTLRILISPVTNAPALGVEHGGLLSAEALLLARYYMFSQVYFHKVRLIYDIHLQEFLTSWLPGGKFSTELADHLAMTDNEVFNALKLAAKDAAASGHESARRVMTREHFRSVWSRSPDDLAKNPEAGVAIFRELQAAFGPENVRHKKSVKGATADDFPVRMDDDRIVSSTALSIAIQRLPSLAAEFVFSSPDVAPDARRFIQENRDRILEQGLEGE